MNPQKPPRRKLLFLAIIYLASCQAQLSWIGDAGDPPDDILDGEDTGNPGTGPSSAVGNLDTAFNNPNGYIKNELMGGAEGMGMVVQPDGKIVVAEDAYHLTGAKNFFVLRFMPDGAVDSSFDSDGVSEVDVSSIEMGVLADDVSTAVALQPDGKILVAGYSSNITGDTQIVVLRLHSNGSPDTSFGSNGVATFPSFTGLGPFSDKAFAIAVASNGKIYVGGIASASGNNRWVVGALDPLGGLDISFAGDGMWDGMVATNPGAVRAIRFQGPNLILIGDYFNSTSYDCVVGRLTPAGVPDLTFNGVGFRVFGGIQEDKCFAGVVTSEGITVAGGFYYSGATDFGVARIKPDGSGLVTAFGDGGTKIIPMSPQADVAYAIGVHDDGKLILGGSTNNEFDTATVRLLANGQPDPSYGTGGTQDFDFGPAPERIRALRILSDGTLLFTGTSFGATYGAFLLFRVK